MLTSAAVGFGIVLSIAVAREDEKRYTVGMEFPTSATRILIAGDTHGDINHAAYLIREAKTNRCDLILQVGDFGYFWPGTKSWKMLERMLNQANLPLYFCDGNHDDFGFLKSINAFGSDHMTAITPHIIYIPRGLIWQWSGKRFMAMGGAVSIDADQRIEGRSWWRDEMVSYADMDRAATNLQKNDARIDVLVTHDCPEGVASLESVLTMAVGYKMDELSRSHRKTIRMLVDRARPKMLFHGHYHARITDTLTLADGTTTQIHGLGCNDMDRASWIELDLP